MNPTTRTIRLASVKGGTGVTTTAVALAGVLHKQGHTVTVESHDPFDLGAIAGESTPSGTLELEGTSETRYTVIDSGIEPTDTRQPAVGTEILVIRACYVALSRASRLYENLTERFDGVILLVEDGRALNANDVRGILGLPVVAELPVDPAIARAVDAGLLLRRPPVSAASLERVAAPCKI